MEFHATLITHVLPLWFLIFSLFLPRIALVVAWLDGNLAPFHLTGLLPPLMGLLLPRVLILYLIYLDQGISIWFLMHLIVALLVWTGSGTYHTRRRLRND
jgi:hypothetical protein